VEFCSLTGPNSLLKYRLNRLGDGYSPAPALAKVEHWVFRLVEFDMVGSV